MQTVLPKAIAFFIQLSELEVALVEALRESPEARAGEGRNPLVRRARLDR